MMTEQRKEELRKALIRATIHVIANDGLDKATTKALATCAQVNEGYIYRVFDGKDDLLTKTFEMLDCQMINLLHGAMGIIRDESLDMETRCYRIFSQLWRFCLAGRNECLCYIRYYYSPYFTKYSSEQHKKMFESVTERFGHVFKQGTDIWHMLVYVLDIIFSSVIRVFRGDLPNTPETEKNVFELLYHSIQPYLSWERL
jgi:AcrR family transcriptional regulator